MSAIAAAWEAAGARGHLRVLAAFAASIVVHACLLALAREWRALAVVGPRVFVVTMRAPGGVGSPGGSAGAGTAAAALAAPAAPAAAARPAPVAAVSEVEPPTQRTAHARIPVRAPERRPEVASAPKRDVAAAPPRRATDTAPSPVNAPRAGTAMEGSAARGAEPGVASAAGGEEGGGAVGTGGSGAGRGRGDGDGAGLGAGEGADGLRALCASCPAPEYPARARRQGWQGTVDVALAIGSDGGVTDALVRRSSGYPALDDVALDVARRSRFTVAAAGAGLRGELRYRFVLDATAARR